MPDQQTLMIVEDERVVAFHLRTQLELLGYRVLAAEANGEDAVRRATELRPHLVLMDIHLEGEMDGVDAAERIHAELGIPVVFLTAYAEETTLKRAQASLPFGYLVKPVDARELHASVRMALTRHAADMAVKRSETRLQVALDAADLDVWEWNVASGQLTAGGRIGALFGGVRTVSENIAVFLARVHPDDRASVGDALQQAVERDCAVDLAFRYARPDGSIGWIEVHAKTTPELDAGSIAVVGVMKEVTERRHTEERLNQAMVVFETTIEGILIMDAEHRIVTANPAFTAITGYTAEEAVGRDPDALFHARRHSDPFYRRLESTTGGQWQGETACRRRNGELFRAWESVSVVRDAQGKVTHFVAVLSDITALRRAEEQLKHLAHHDPLTGLPNRLLMNDRLEQAIEVAQRTRRRCALLFLDVDGFKVINDTLGHSAGDRLLQVIAARLAGSLRRTDTAARIGGDEFVLVLGDIGHPNDVARIARKVLDVLSVPIELAGDRVGISASMGIALFPDDGPDRFAVLKAADTAMYESKVHGRNRFSFYTREMAELAAERLAIEQGLRRALQSDGLLLHYQPQLALADGTLSGIEALVRWPEGGAASGSPARFIPVAEECGLIAPLGRWVLDRACRETRSWLDSAGEGVRLAVNVSPRELAREDFEQSVREVLERTGFPPHRLEIEITESSVQLLEHNARLLDTLRALGVHVAIDDFGTGYSSLSVIKGLPIDRLKIDQSFVRDLTTNVNDEAIIEAIIAMSRTLGLRITAEGVETEGQLAALRRLGCDEAQGFLFSHPMPIGSLSGIDRQALGWPVGPGH